MSTDPYDKLEPVLDRFQEAHFWLHMIEKYYHHADHFRWHLNVFLKATKEVPQLVKMTLQNETGFTAWYGNHSDQIRDDPLLAMLSKHRDYIVHQGTLKLKSHGVIGLTEGRGIKLGFGSGIDPLEDSDNAMERLLRVIAERGDFLDILKDDEDSVPCVKREWRLPDLEGEIVDVCAAAWLRVGQALDGVLRWLGAEPPPLSLNCRHSSQQVQFKLYDRNQLQARLDEIRRVPA